MKRLFILLNLLLVITFLNANELLQKTLPNGMQIVVKENRLNESVGFYCFVKTGSNNEGRFVGAGISHYLEHIVSSGATTYRTETEYQKLSQEMGALVNAYTTNVITAFHIEVGKQYEDLALQVLSEQLTSSLCDSFEVAREKQVILKEIVMRSTPPMSKVYQMHNELVYPNSNNHYPVIGYPELFKTISRDELQEYYKERYAPNNMIFVAVGDFQADEMLVKVENAFKDFKRRQFQPVYLPPQNPRAGTIEYVQEFDIEQPTVFISTVLPAENYIDQPALEMALEILFSKRQSPIRFKLVEELNLVNYIYASADGTADKPEGMIDIMFEAKDPARIKEIVQIIDEEIEKYSKSGFTQDQIENLINSYKASRLLTTPSLGRDANEIGWSLLRYGVPDYYPTSIKIMESLTPADLEAALQKYIVPQNRVIFYAVPLGTEDIIESQDQIMAEKTDVKKVELKKNLTLLYKKNTEKPFIQGVVYLPITTDYETIENSGSLSFMLDLMFSGSKNYDPMDITEWFEYHAADLDININSLGTYIEFKCLKADYSTLEDMLIDAFQNPSFTESEIKLAKEQTEAGFKRSLSRAGSLHNDFLAASLYPETVFGLSREAKKNIVMKLSRNDLKNLHKTYFNAQSAIITFVGDLTQAEAETYAENLFKNIPNKKINVEQTHLITPEIDADFLNKYKFEQVNVDLNMPAPKMSDADFKAMTVINLLCNGARGRIFVALRGENDLAYYGYSSYSYSDYNGYFRLTSQTSIDKKDELLAVLKGELTKLKTLPASAEELVLAIDENQKMLDAYLNDNRLPYYITHYEAIGLGYDYLENSVEFLQDVTPEDIIRVANKYFKNFAVIVSEPSEDVELIVE
ncbi:MAG: pitrilysin family protein [Candidatus Cloacimonadales bacterium]|nr:pitrilysin family protein [Candidatus Cloacimonadales bacterium]